MRYVLSATRWALDGGCSYLNIRLRIWYRYKYASSLGHASTREGDNSEIEMELLMDKIMVTQLSHELCIASLEQDLVC